MNANIPLNAKYRNTERNEIWHLSEHTWYLFSFEVALHFPPAYICVSVWGAAVYVVAIVILSHDEHTDIGVRTQVYEVVHWMLLESWPHQPVKQSL